MRHKENENINLTNLQNQLNSLQEEYNDLYVKCKNYEEKYNEIMQKNGNNKIKN